MTSTTAKSPLWQGAIDGLPFTLVIGPFGLLFGVVATEAGFDVVQTLGFTVLVIAGAAQFTAVQLMVDEAPTILVLAASLAVNLRMAMYSASLVPHLGAAPLWQRAVVAYFTVDQAYATAMLRFEHRGDDMSVGDRVAYFLGIMVPIAPLWYGSTLVGALVGTRIPPDYALDFALPITFLALVAPALRTGAHAIAALTATVVALATAGLPAGIGIMIAGLSGMLAGAQAELWIGRRT